MGWVSVVYDERLGFGYPFHGLVFFHHGDLRHVSEATWNANANRFCPDVSAAGCEIDLNFYCGLNHYLDVAGECVEAVICRTRVYESENEEEGTVADVGLADFDYP